MPLPLSCQAPDIATFKAMLDQAPSATALLSPAGEITYANAAFAELHDESVELLPGRSIRDLIDENDQDDFFGEIRRLAAGECETTGVESLNAGIPRKTRYRLSPRRDESGELSAVILYGQRVGSVHVEPLPELTLDTAQALFEKSPIPMWVFDVQSLRFLSVNRACLQHYGYTRDEFLGMTTREIRPSGEIPKLLSALMDINSAPYPGTHWIHRRKDGSTFMAEVFATPIRFRSREARLVLSFDVTRRVESERALMERNTMLEALGDNIPGGAVYQIMQDGPERFRFTFFSAGFQRLFQMDPGAVIADPQVLLRAIHRDDWGAYAAAQARSMRDKTPFDHEFRHVTPDGEVKWVPCLCAPRELPDGRVAWDGVVTEITERKATEERLRRQEELLRSVGDNLPGGVIYQYVSEADGSGRYTYLSAGVEKISECSREDMMAGRVRLRDLMAPEERDRIVRTGQSAGNPQSITDTEVSVRLPSGRERIWHVRSAIHRNENGAVTWDGVILDVTDRRKLESQVQQAQKYQSVSVLAGGIAHDFNNLLTGVLGYAELATAETPTDLPAHEYLTEIGISARRAADLCKQMLAYAGKGRLVRGSTDLSGLVREMTRLLRTAISRKTVLQLNLTEGLPSVEGDATQLRQVVMNLITNASESLEEKPGVIIIRTGLMSADSQFFRATVLREDLPQGTYAFLEVEDTGCGMSPETQARIFEPFFTTKFSGRGLGLAALLGIVRSHRGAVRVSSEAGRGTTIRIVLPVQAATSETATPTPGPELPKIKTGPVLLIDDEESVRNIARTVLEKEGFLVTVAEDGEAGLEAFRNAGGEFLLVLTDLTMPKLTGLETLIALREARPDARVVLMSGYGESEVLGRYGQYGFTGFLQKPFAPLELMHAIEKAVRTPNP